MAPTLFVETAGEGDGSLDGLTAANSVTFGQWRYDRRVNTLARSNGSGDFVAVTIGSRALQVLSTLLREPGALVSKDALMDAVWPGVTVEPNNLTVHIAALRRLLDEGAGGESCIQTVPGRGYRFVKPVDDPEVPPAITGTLPTQAPALDLAGAPAVRGGRSRWPALAACGVIAMLSGCLVVWSIARSSSDKAVLPDRQQLAVLPLVTIGDGGDYFADGLTEDLIAGLGRFSEIAVRARSAVIGYKDHPAPPGEIGRALAVRYILEGSVQRAADRVRVAVRLIGADTGTVLWSETYDNELKEVFAVQDDITRQVAGVASVQLDALALASSFAKPPDRLEAYDLVLRGRDRLRPVTRVGTSEARALFEQAVALGPNYAAAYVGLARTDLQALEQGWTGDPRGTLARAVANGQKAVALQADDPGAHAILGRALVRSRNYEGGLDELKRAVTLNSSDPEAMASYGDVLSLSGDSKAGAALMEEAARFRPNRPVGEYFSLGIAYLLTGRPADAARTFEQGRTTAGELPWFSVLLAISYTQLGRTTDAAREVARVHRLLPGFDVSTFGSLLRRPEDRDLLRATLREAGL